MTPGDPIERILGPEASQSEVERVRDQLGLNDPLFHQYIDYLKGLPTGEMGSSLYKDTPVHELLVQHIPPTMTLALIAVGLAFFLGTFLGITAGAKRASQFDSYSRILSLLALSFPIFSLAPLLVLLFAIYWQVLPVSEWGGIRHMILPIMSLTIPLSAVLMRVARNKYLEEYRAPWVQVLAAKGMGTTGIRLRLVKVCLPTILNVVAIQLSVVLAGTMITETIFDIPGMGLLLFEGIQNRDYPIVQGVIAYSTLIYMVIYFLVDVLNTKIDPRIEA
jgi:peptide/nickel transport system permease protein